MLRWTIRIVVTFVALIAITAVIVHLVLQSEWLGETVLARVSRKLGLLVDCESFSVTWGGTTALRDATIRMPLTDEVVLSANRIELGHEVIPLLILGRPLDLHAVRVDHPTAHLRRYASGRWNAQDVWTRLKVSLDSAQRRDRAGTLPEIGIEDALIQITEPNGAVQAVGPIEFQARPHAQLLWSFALRAPGAASVDGRLIRGGDWAHHADFAAQGIEPLVHHLLQRDLSPIQVEGRWNGRMLQDALSGVVELDRLAIGPVAVHGAARIEATTDRLTVSPHDLVFSEPNIAGEAIQLAAGAIELSQKQVTLRQLALKTGARAGQVNGSWDWGPRAGEFSGSWVAALPEQPAQYHGAWQASFRSPPSGRGEVEATASIEAQTPAGAWSAVAETQGGGVDWRQSRWLVSVPTLRWSRGKRHVDMDGMAAEMSVHWPEIQLTSLHVPSAQHTAAVAVLDLRTRLWSAQLEAQDLHLEALGADGVSLRLNAEGDARQARISELRVAAGARVAAARGRFSFSETDLQDFRLSADWPAGPSPVTRRSSLESPSGQRILPSDERLAARDDGSEEPPIGRWHLEADVTGRVRPAALEVDGALTGQNVSLGRRLVDRLEVPLRAKADAKVVHMATEPFDLLGGQWELSGQHELSSQTTELSFVADKLSLAAAASMAGVPLASQGQAQAEVRLVMPRLDLQKAVATGSWSALDINLPPLAAERAHGKLRISGGLVRFDDIQLEQGAGRAHAGLEFLLEDPQTLSVDITTEAWPVRLGEGPLTMLADGQAKLQVNIVKNAVTGEARVASRILWKEQDLAHVRLSTLVQGQTLDVRELHAEALGGSVEGKARVPLNRWMGTVAQLQWREIEPKLLGRWMPQFERFEGAVSGSLVIDQADAGARAPEPMRLALDVDIAGGRLGPAQIDDCHVVGYLGSRRLLIDEAGFQVLGGRLDGRARVSTHAGGRYASVAVDFNDLNLDQLVHVIDPNAGQYAGLLSGRGTVLSSAGRLSLGGQSRVDLKDSDLVNNGVVATLYNTLKLQFGKQQPTGTGQIDIRLEGSSVAIPSFLYFNRGVEIRGAGEIADVRLGAESPVDGFAVASTRVLKGIPLPGVNALDRMLATFQTGASSVKIGGTLDNVEVTVVPLPVVLDSFRRLLWAQLRE